jgi:hypothetical protein
MGRDTSFTVVARLRVGLQRDRGSISGEGTDPSLHKRVQTDSGAHRAPYPNFASCLLHAGFSPSNLTGGFQRAARRYIS